MQGLGLEIQDGKGGKGYKECKIANFSILLFILSGILIETLAKKYHSS